jgi:hypothetical protein
MSGGRGWPARAEGCPILHRMRVVRTTALITGLLVLGGLGALLMQGTPAAPAPDGTAAADNARVHGAGAVLGQAPDTTRQPVQGDERDEDAGAGGSTAAAPQARDNPADPALVLLSCDADDHPVADVPVGLLVGSPAAIAWRGRTRVGDGMVRVPMPRALLRRFTGPVAASLLLPLRHGAAVTLDPEALPKAPVKLVLPPTGRVFVWIDDLLPAAAGKVDVGLGVAGQPALDGSYAAEVSAHPVDGVAKFDFVGLGLSLLVRASRPGQSEQTRLVTPGPVAPGETVHVHLRAEPPPERIVFVMHVVDAADKAVAKTQLSVALEARAGGSSSSSTFSIATDEEGVLRLAVDDTFKTMPERSLRLRGTDARPQPVEALVTLPEALVPGANDLGVVRLVPPPLVCGGRIVDHDGVGVAGADLQVEQRSTGQPSPQQVRGLRCRSDADGRFELRGSSPPTDLSLHVTATGHLPRDQAFVLGVPDLEVRLDPAAALAGSVRLDEVVLASDVLVELTDADGTHMQRLTVHGQLGDFVFDRLPPGTANVRVHLLGDPDGVTADNVPLRSGETTRDPRLQEIDLGKGRHVVNFTVVDQMGQPVPDAQVVVRHGELQRAFEGYRLAAGQGRIVARPGPVAVIAFADDFRTVQTDALTDGARIVLPPALAVRFTLPAGCPVPTAPFALGLRLDPADSPWPADASYRLFQGLHSEYSGNGTVPWLRHATADCGPGGETRVLLPAPGRWSVTWRLSWQQPGTSRSELLANDPPAVTVADVPDEQFVRAGLRGELLQAAMQRLVRGH